jgi:hypothetical protein
MPRIRTIKPEFATDEKLARVSRDARLTFVLCITQADDDGLLPGNSRQLLASLFPLDESMTAQILDYFVRELVEAGRLRWRETVDGSPILEIVQWARHQRVDHKGKSLILPHLKPYAEPVASASGESREDVARVSRSDLGPRTVDLGPSTPPAKPAAIRRTVKPPPADRPDPFPKPICDAGYEAFVARIGAVEYSRYRKALLPIYRSETSAHPTGEQLTQAAEAFAEAREAIEPKWRNSWTVEKFGQSLHEYVRLGAMPLNDEWGEWTERGRAAGLASA